MVISHYTNDTNFACSSFFKTCNYFLLKNDNALTIFTMKML